jgi:hypothetical protein
MEFSVIFWRQVVTKTGLLQADGTDRLKVAYCFEDAEAEDA